ncbi:MAG TPA: cation diffusion facilitator family transporter [Bryobacteraceae bacterium]|jgi:cation diffusion facilitator family transporter
MQKATQIARTGMVVSGLLGALKIGVGLVGHSAAVTADGFESAADVFTSGMVLVGMKIAARPPDENHPYGHGRVEILTGLLLGFLLFGAGLIIALHAWANAGSVAAAPAAYAIWPVVISIGVKFAMVTYKRRAARQLSSSALRADAANDAVDIVSGVVALTALMLTLEYPSRFSRADQYGAFIVATIVMATAVRVAYEAAMHLMDTMPDDIAMEDIRRAAATVPDVAGVEKCFARKTGLKYHVDLHLEVDPDITVRASHDIAQRVRERVCELLPWVADVLVHVEPAPGQLRKRD